MLAHDYQDQGSDDSHLRSVDDIGKRLGCCKIFVVEVEHLHKTEVRDPRKETYIWKTGVTAVHLVAGGHTKVDQ